MRPFLEVDMVNLKNLKIGDKIYLPLYPERDPLLGTVIYIHENHHFFTVAFRTESGAYIRESFNFYGPLAISEKGQNI